MSLACAVVNAALLVAPLAPAGGQWLIVVTGLGGEARFRDRFHAEATELIDAAVDRWGLDAEHVIYLGENPSFAPDRIDGKSTAEEIAATLGAVAGQAGADDEIVIVLIGHGAADGEPRLNLPGPDLTADEWAALLDGFGSRRLAFINTASSSGGFIEAVAGPDRIAITATRSGRERTETRFARHFVDAYAADGADTDKDGRISLLEAYAYTEVEVARSYEAEGLVLTEHAVLEDPDGLAGRFFLGGRTGGATIAANPELAALYDEKARLEAAIEDLRSLRESMPEADYEDSLEALVVELALTTRAIEQAEGGTR